MLRNVKKLSRSGTKQAKNLLHQQKSVLFQPNTESQTVDESSWSQFRDYRTQFGTDVWGNLRAFEKMSKEEQEKFKYQDAMKLDAYMGSFVIGLGASLGFGYDKIENNQKNWFFSTAAGASMGYAAWCMIGRPEVLLGIGFFTCSSKYLSEAIDKTMDKVFSKVSK